MSIAPARRKPGPVQVRGLRPTKGGPRCAPRRNAGLRPRPCGDSRAGLCYHGRVTPPDDTLWDFIPGLETSDAYAAFEDYRDQDPKHRTLASAARRSGASYPTIARWAKENYWHDRVEAYDKHRADMRARELARQDAADAETWAEQRAEILAKLRQASLQGLDQLVHDLANRRTRMRPNEIKQITDLLLKFGNLANGDATERVDNVIDLSQASDEDLAALERLRSLEKSEENETTH